MKKFETPDLEVKFINFCDVICASGLTADDLQKGDENPNGAEGL